jgi:uncharacterized protein (DUF362 family)
MSLVSFIHIGQKTFNKAIESSLNVLNYRFPDNIENIIIKPNLCYYWQSSTGQTTDPLFIGALIEVLRQKIKSDPKISIVESDASAMKCAHVFKFLGYDRISKEYGVDLVNLSNEDYGVVKINVKNHLISLRVPHMIRNADLRINVPKLKYSIKKIGITCAMKNLYGCNPYIKKYKLHPYLGEAIVAINKAMPFNLNILDGNIVYGVGTRRLGLVMASEDPVAFDSAAAKIAGLNPNKLDYLKMAEDEGLGSIKFVERGVPLSFFSCLYPKAPAIMKIKMSALNLVVSSGLSRFIGF